MSKKSETDVASATIARPKVFWMQATLYGCRKESLLTAGSATHLRSVGQRMRRTLTRSGLSILRFNTNRYTKEEHHGFTFAAIIGESHIAGDTWPEHHSVFINIAVCNASTEGNEKKMPKAIRDLKRFFKARRIEWSRGKQWMYLDEPRTKKRTFEKRRRA